MKNPRALLLLGLLTLAACGTAPAPDTHNPPVSAPDQALRDYGLYELNVSGLDTDKPSSQVSPMTVAPNTEVQGLQYTLQSIGTHTDEVSRTRYIQVSFKVTNPTTQNIGVPTYVPVDTSGSNATIGTTPFLEVRSFDGTSVSSRAAEMVLTTAYRFNSTTGTSEVDPNATPFVRELDTRALKVTAPKGTTVVRIFQEGWQGRALPAGGSQTVTFATRVPMASQPKYDPASFRLVFAVTDNPASLALDKTPPTVSVSVTPTTLTTAGSATIRATATDNKGVKSVSFYDGAALLGTDTQAPYEWIKAYTAADNGTRSIRAVATDTSGNTATAQTTLTVNIPNTPPPFLGSGPATLATDLIRSNRGEGVQGSTVRIYKTGDRTRVLAEAQTNASGYAEFAKIPEGSYDLVFSKTGAAGSEFNGAIAKAGINHRLKVAQFDAQNPTASKTTAKLALLTPTALNATGAAVDWKTLTPGTVMNDSIQLRAYTTTDNPTPLQLKYLMFSLVSFDASGQMSEFRTNLSPIDAGSVIPGMNKQDSGQVTMDATGLKGDIYVQVSALDFNNNRSAYLVPIRLERSAAAGNVAAPTGVSAVGYTTSERINYIYEAPTPDLTPQAAQKDTNSWVTVSWDMPASTDGLTGYRVLRATAADGPYAEVAFASAAQCSATTKRCAATDNTATLQVGQDYYYRVKAIGSNEALSAVPDRVSTRLLTPFTPQLLTPGAEQTGVELLPVYTFKTNAFNGGATGLRVDLRVSDTFTSVSNMDAPSLRVISQNGTFSITGAGTDTRDYSKWVTYDAATDTLKIPHDLSRVRSGLAPLPLQANRRYSWLLHRAYTYRLQDPTQPESATNPVVAYAVYSDPDTTKVVPGGVTQSVSTIHHFITRP
ncbi:Ig-like domain-containing protein [Deinococcus fonticola]|uniref:Ig-like domain-containing protein n=1 Tax=Deinococcus fonticola TaxID=2528713 RepID=UPI00107560FF|nr:Ig-like domain-containing protein [Deinococcus fonticola]